MKLYLSDNYKIEIHYPIDETSVDALYLLYQPIIGSHALNLYMTLMSEGKRMTRYIQPCSFSRLISMMTLSLVDIEKYIKVLEGIGLLRTFVKHVDQQTFYLFVIQSPLSLPAFFKNRLLQTLLYEALGQNDFDKTKAYFKLSMENKENYEEMTASFHDVFQVDLKKSQGKVLKISDEYKNKKTNDIELDYDLDLFYQELKNYQIPKSIINEEDEKIIIQYALVYSIDVLSMVSIVKDSIVKKHLDYDILKSNVLKFHEVNSSSQLTEVYLKQPVQYKINDNNHSALIQHLHYLENISPYELLKRKQGGKEPVFHDLRIVETLMVQLGLKPGVINVLIEYVLNTNHNRLSRSYCEAIGSSWARKNIINVKQAYEEAIKNKEDIIEDEVVVEENNSEEFMSLLNELKEGKL
jgi:Replication initiation/membrane attachment protein